MAKFRAWIPIEGYVLLEFEAESKDDIVSSLMQGGPRNFPDYDDEEWKVVQCQPGPTLLGTFSRTLSLDWNIDWDFMKDYTYPKPDKYEEDYGPTIYDEEEWETNCRVKP